VATALENNSPGAERVAERLGFSAGGGRTAREQALAAVRSARANGMGGLGLRDAARLSLQAGGRSVPLGDEALWKASIGIDRGVLGLGGTSSDFTNLLSNVANKTLMTAFVEINTVWQLVCRRGVATDFKTANVVSASEAANFRKKIEGTPNRTFSFSDRKAEIAVESAGERFGLTYQAFRNDDLGAFSRVPAMMGAAARRYPEALFWTLVLSNSGAGPTAPDGNALFDESNHNNKPTGSALAFDTLNTARVRMMRRKGFGTDTAYIMVEPRVIVTPPELQVTAWELTQSATKVASSQNNAALPNFMQGVFIPAVTPYITTTTAWYLFSDPSVLPTFEMRFLDGQEDPTITQLPVSDPQTLEWDATLPGVGCACTAHEGALYNVGA